MHTCFSVCSHLWYYTVDCHRTVATCKPVYSLLYSACRIRQPTACDDSFMHMHIAYCICIELSSVLLFVLFYVYFTMNNWFINWLCRYTGENATNFIIGLTIIHPLVNSPVIGNYNVCGQYPGVVPRGATVRLQCENANLQPARYVVVQID